MSPESSSFLQQIQRPLIPLEMTNELAYMTDFKVFFILFSVLKFSLQKNIFCLVKNAEMDWKHKS